MLNQNAVFSIRKISLCSVYPHRLVSLSDVETRVILTAREHTYAWLKRSSLRLALISSKIVKAYPHATDKIVQKSQDFTEISGIDL